MFKGLLIQVEMLHATHEVPEWLIDHFVMQLVPIDGTVVVPVAAATDCRRLLAAGLFFGQDAILATDLLVTSGDESRNLRVTALVGSYESVNEQPVAFDSELDFTLLH